MTSYAPDPQATTGPFTAPVTLVAESRAARHRTTHPETEIPAWLQLTATIIAVAVGWFAIAEWRDPAAPLLMGVALLIAVGALALDVTAALNARRTGTDA